MGANTKMTKESIQEVLKNDSIVWGAGLYAEGKKDLYIYKCDPELYQDILRIYRSLTKQKHYHPVLAVMQREVGVIIKRLYGEIPQVQPHLKKSKIQWSLIPKDLK